MITIERRHRLDLSCYEGLVRASFTLCIKDRKTVFTNASIVENFTNIFENSIRKYSCVNWVYLFMPDHFHFILEGTRLDANLWKSVVLFKQNLNKKLAIGFRKTPHLYNGKKIFLIMYIEKSQI